MTIGGVRQIAYVVSDVRRAARRHHEIFGSGPFFVVDHIPVRLALHRGSESQFDHSSAYGQWGDVMVEFMCQHDDAPSAVRDVYGRGEEGFHHVAMIVDDLTAARAHFAQAGLVEAMYTEMADGFPFVMIDARAAYGHMLELYEGVPALVGFYDFVRSAARGFDGADPIRTITLGRGRKTDC